jgi:ABC-2 type transport system ATP-binding protein
MKIRKDETMSTVIKIENLSKFYGKKQALKDINLTIEQGMFGLLGRNGAGKTTLMKVLTTLLPKNQGSITICGVPISKEAEIRRMTGYLPQDFSMYANMSVYEAMDYLGVLAGLSKEIRREKIPVLLEKVNLNQNKRTKVKALSGGMKRRLGIAQAILHEPKILIVDEPTAGLDPEERVRFRNLLCEIAEDRIVILSTHIVGDIEATCERIAVLESGEMLYNGTVTDLVNGAKGKIYSAEINKKELPLIKEHYPITSMITMGNLVNVRFVANEKPFDFANPCEVNVEDAYMYLMHEKRGGI